MIFNNERSNKVNNEPNKPAEELTEKELESITGGGNVNDGEEKTVTQ